MALFSIIGKGIIKEIEIIDNKRVVVLPDNFDSDISYVRIYRLKKLR